MSNNPWAEGSSERVLEDATGQHQQPPAVVVDGPLENKPASEWTSSRPFDTMEEDEENVWGEARQQVKPNTTGRSTPTVPGGINVETNPFLRKKVSATPETAPTEALSKLNISETGNNPWQQAIETEKPQPPGSISSTIPPAEDKASWPNKALTPEPVESASPAVVSLPSGRESPAWDEDLLGSHERVPAPPLTAMSDELAEESHVWDDLGSSNKGKEKATNVASSPDEWNLIDLDTSAETKEPPEEGQLGLPPTEKPAWKPSREPVDGAETYQVKNIKWHDPSSEKNPRTSPILIQNANGPCPLVALVNALTLTTPAEVPDTALVQVLRSREQVSLNLLLDAVFDELMSPRRTSSEDELPDVSDLYAFLQSLHTGMNVNPRFIPTPRMVQAYKRTSLTHLHPIDRTDLIPGTFENTGEMALYATFSIPLIHGWLPRKTGPEYAALDRQAASYEDAQNLLFREEELEQKLLDPEAGLDEEEQELYQDILIIKSFLTTSATQLTDWGIEVIGQAIRPGTFAILFRNDHFSTLYRHPQTSQLMTLVTDAGFKSHDDIVWETLVDVSGESADFLSGDFQVVNSDVGHGSTSAGRYSNDDGGEWTPVRSKRGKSKQEDETPLSPSTEQEDRDLALALQLQEEEDERHRAAEARRRRESILSEQYIEQQGRQPPLPARPNQGSVRGDRGDRGGRGGGMERGGGTHGLVPARSSSNTQQRPQSQQAVRSLIPPQQQGVTQGVTRGAARGVTRPTESGSEDAPPSYEQAANDVPYQPPPGHPNHAQSNPALASQAPRQQAGPVPRRSVRQRPVSPGALAANSGPYQGRERDRDRECIVM